MGKSSKQTIGYWYHPAFHMGLGYGPADALLEIRGGDKTAWSGQLTASGTITVNAPNLWGGEKDQGGMAGDMDIMFGEPTQTPNAYLTATFGSQQPAWRGFMTAVWKGGRYGAMNPYPQKISYKWRKIKMGWDGDPGDGSACWYPEKAAVPVGQEAEFGVQFRVKFVALSDDTDYSAPSVDDSAWSFGQLPLISNGYVGSTTIANAGFANQPGTIIPLSTNAWFRGYLSVDDPPIDIPVSMWADNGAQIWVNGTKVIDFYSRDGGPGSGTIPASALHAGNNAIAIKYISDGQGESYFGIHINLPLSLLGMNPAHTLYYARTQQHMGREPTANINDASFKAAADWYYAQGFGLCTTYDASQESIDAFIARIEKVAGCSMTRSPADGLWYLDVANGQYDIDSLPILTDDDILAFTMQPATLDSAINSVSVQYFDPQQKTTVSTRPVEALALVSAYGRSHQDTSYPEIPISGLALRVAQRDLQATATPTHGFEITATRVAHAWRKGTYFRLQAPKHSIADMVCIVGDPDSGTLSSGAIKFTAVEDIYSLPASSFAEQEGGVDTRPSQIPLPITQQEAFEAPYFEVIRNLSRADLAVLPADVGYAMTVAQDPATSRDYTITGSTDGGTTYAGNETAPWCPAALIVEGDTLTDASPTTDFTLANGALLSNVAVGAAALWDAEIVRVDAIDPTAGTLTLGRGCADTLPAAHAPNSLIWFFDGFSGSDRAEYTVGESIAIKLLTNTGSQQLDPSLATPMALTFAQRQFRPYPPAALTINGDAWNAPSDPLAVSLTFAWATRNRVSQADQLIDQAAASVTPEDGQTTTIRIYDLDDTLIDTLSGLTGTSTVYTPSEDGSYRIEVESERDGIASLQKYNVVVDFVAALTFIVTEDGNNIVTEDGNPLIQE